MIEVKNEVKGPSLYELTADLQSLLDFGYTDEDEDVFLDTLDGILAGIGDKSDGYVAVMDHFNANIQMIKAEEERLRARREAVENRVTKMKEALKNVLEVMEQGGAKAEIKTALHTIKLAGNGGKQPLMINEEKVPDSFKKVILETDKDKIRKAIEAGEDVSDFAELLPRGRHVSIR